MKTIRVMVVDDSNFMRKALSKLIMSEPGFEVVEMASNGYDALRKLSSVKPDAITLDVEMEGMDGLTTLKKIMESPNPTSVIMFSAYTKSGADITVNSLREGAVDFMEKPSGALSMDLGAVRDELIRKLRVAARVTPMRKSAEPLIDRKTARSVRLPRAKSSIVAIGSSTGGVQALNSIIPKLPEDFPLPIVIVQHMPPLFTKTLADGLNKESKVSVKEGEEGDVLKPGCVYIAPGGLHMTVRKAGSDVMIHLDKNPEGELLRPSVDVLFRSVADLYGGNVLGVVLSGMGNDGFEGMKVLRAKGAVGMAQNEATCVVYGMPKFVIEANLVDVALPLSSIALHIEASVS